MKCAVCDSHSVAVVLVILGSLSPALQRSAAWAAIVASFAVGAVVGMLLTLLGMVRGGRACSCCLEWYWRGKITRGNEQRWGMMRPRSSLALEECDRKQRTASTDTVLSFPQKDTSPASSGKFLV